MTSEEFVALIKEFVCDAAVRSTVKGMSNVGKIPSGAKGRLSAWYRKLPDHDKEFVEEAIRRGVEAVIFRLFCVLDHVATIEPYGEKGRFQLSFTKAGTTTVLNDRYNPLHDIFGLTMIE
jgi:hypothetical protein